MDTSGFCQVGRHGTLSLLKRQGADEPDGILTSFGIDDDELTFGSSTACGVRLYYPDVNSLHCKIVFDQFKAFLAILGSSGVVVDGCQVFPHTSGETSVSMRQTLVALNNNSVFEIHGKRFKFNYPPKELRKALYSTPARPPQRALRLSMIHSAQVFSPRPSSDPRENLRILQSPVKKPSSPIKNPSPLKSATLPEIEEEEDEIVLVHTNHPRVVEEEKDLVILEDVPVQLLSPVKTTLPQFPVIQAQHQPPSTPRRRSLGGTALHRAVLIRSAQRAVLKAEKEREEVQEELEVIGAVVGNEDGDDRATMVTDVEDVEMSDVDEEDEDMDGDEETDDEDEDDDEPETQTQKSLWRKSLERIIPWSLSGSGVETDAKDREEDEGHRPATNRGENQKEEPLELFPPIKPSGKRLGPFMTPQPQTRLKEDVRRVGSQAGRLSLGGPARRIIVEQPWKVHDLVLPPSTPLKGDPRPLMPIEPPASNTLTFTSPATTLKSATSRAGTPTNGNSIPAVITEEERRAIQERRRSAVKEFTSGPLWAGGAPGMSPTKGSLNASNIISPNKPTGTVSSSNKLAYGSPTKIRPSERLITERRDSNVRTDDDEDLDTSGLLDKIKETVNGMKRRRSIILGGVSTPQSLTSVPEDFLAPPAKPTASATPEEASVRKVDFTKIATPPKPSKHLSTPKASPQKSSAKDEERSATPPQDEPFSLLRPGALEGRRQSILSTPVRKEQVVTVVPVPLIKFETLDKSEEAPSEIVGRGRTRALRSAVGIEDPETDTKLKATKIDISKARSPRRQRSKTPQPATLADAAVDVSSVAVSQRVSRSAASEKLTTADATPKPIPEETDNVVKPATRRVRKAQTTAKAEDEPKPTQVAPKRGRPRKNAAPTETSQEEGEGLMRPARKPPSKARSTGRKKTPMDIRETDSEDDPLDCYEIECVPPSTSAEEDKDMASDSPTPADTKSKAKTQAAATRAKAARVKKDEPIEESSLPTTTTRNGRRTKATTVSQTPDVATPAVKATTGKTRGRPKTPATAPANTGVSIAEEKENTRSSKLRTTEKVSGNPETEEAPVKLRVSRSRAASRAVKAIEEDDEQAPPARQRATRVMRTRTKTG